MLQKQAADTALTRLRANTQDPHERVSEEASVSDQIAKDRVPFFDQPALGIGDRPGNLDCARRVAHLSVNQDKCRDVERGRETDATIRR